MEILSLAFKEGDYIPKEYTCDGGNFSPPLRWKGVPEGTKSLALICDDPDAPGGSFVHWVIYNIPPSVEHLDEDVGHSEHLGNGAIQGKNDYGKIGYKGPCPPSGVHRYFFYLYALDDTVTMKPGMKKDQLEREMKDHMLEECSIMGNYRRS